MKTLLKDFGLALEAIGVLAIGGAVVYFKFKLYVNFFSFKRKSDIQTLSPKD